MPFVSQQRARTTDALLTGTTLISPAADFNAAQVGAGDVVLVAGTPFEVIVRNDANTLTVSLPRTDLSGDLIPGEDGAALELIARTFAPQASLVHDALLRLLGVDVDDPDGELDEDAVVSLSLMAQLEALGTLERVYSGALALTGDNDPIAFKARYYADKFNQAVRRASVLVDVNGDGHAEERRRFGLIRLSRA